MTKRPEQEEIRKWHQWFAVECNNAAWNLIEKPQRTAAEDRHMINVAYAAAFHWSMVGKPINDARAELTLSRVFAVVGNGGDALRYAQRCLAYCDNNECEEWDIALGYVAMAHAGALLDDKELHSRYYQAAREKAAALNDDDRGVVEAELARVPKP